MVFGGEGLAYAQWELIGLHILEAAGTMSEGNKNVFLQMFGLTILLALTNTSKSVYSQRDLSDMAL